MNINLGLETLSQIMNWSSGEASAEFEWIRFMSAFKYDDYRDYIAGSRFVESLARWLQQFTTNSERRAAYAFVRSHLVYIGEAEMQRLIEAFFPDVVYPNLLSDVAKHLNVTPYNVLRHPSGSSRMHRSLASTLFMALSDGARIDALRRSNYRRVMNDQVFVNPRLDRTQWEKALKDVRSLARDETALIECVYLIDDFTASGTTFCRFDPVDKEWQGKLIKFRESTSMAQHVFADSLRLRVHHLIGTEQAAAAAEVNNRLATSQISEWFKNVSFTFGTVLPEQLKIIDDAFLDLSDKYYDVDLETSHTKRSGVKDMKRGYGGCALPLVLSHNTPNNSLPLLWAETGGVSGHPIRPLFRRRQRHG